METKVKIRVTRLEVNVSGQPTHECNHYQWVDWPDRGVPEADLAPIFLLAKLKENTLVGFFQMFEWLTSSPENSDISLNPIFFGNVV
ncbi:unnamed protein product [Strongylus vulgaris]|uniref:Tyrosine-protein phosphatase domain-containing protein n=1 Tax=Strongylus vulgaris TaxID=40348 RepID=A0A3P7IHE5_STRVU|nr:unnamed protein product [Strongylus vulgaris]